MVLCGPTPIYVARKPSQPVFQQGDTLILLDGRSPSTFEVLSKELGKVLRAPAVASTLPARKWIVIRRFFRNAEFELNGYASKARRQNLNPLLPDPLENLIYVANKKTKLSHRSSSDNAVVTDNFSRGWSSLGMKTRLEQDFSTITPACYETLLKGDASSCSEGATEDAQTMPQDGHDDEAEGPEEAREGSESAVWCTPWECSESDCKLIVDLYKPDGCKRIICAEAGSGSCAMHCVRHQMHITMLAETEAHKDFIFQSVVCRIVYEILLGNAQHFVMRSRILKRETSLSGEGSVTSTAKLPPPVPIHNDHGETANDDEDMSDAHSDL